LSVIPPADANAASCKPFLLPAPVPLDGFAPEEFKARRGALRAACPDGIILVRGATEEEVVNPGNYQQNHHFFYLTGVDTPGAFLVLLPDGVSASSGMRDAAAHLREFLYLPARDARRETWTGAQIGPGEETEAQTGIEKTADVGGIWGNLVGWLRRCPLIYTVAPYGEQAQLTPEYALMRRIQELAPTAQFRDVAPAIGQLRVVKSPAEIERIARAVEITAAGHRAARALIARGAGRNECEVEAEILAEFRRQGAKLAFAGIVGAGPNATVLHYEDNNRVMQEGEVVVVDIGARWGHYCGDLTRAYPVGGHLSPRQRDIYDQVLAAHEQVVTSYQPGVDTLKTLTDRCKQIMKDSPLRGKDGDGVEQTMDAFMPHGITHHLGLYVHDVGDQEPPLTPGNVITIEPGLYIPSEGIGIRIEDDYLVTATGLQRLGPPLEKAADAVERAMISVISGGV
jgi:Xaa-Pro aminopeptidase